MKLDLSDWEDKHGDWAVEPKGKGTVAPVKQWGDWAISNDTEAALHLLVESNKPSTIVELGMTPGRSMALFQRVVPTATIIGIEHNREMFHRMRIDKEREVQLPNVHHYLVSTHRGWYNRTELDKIFADYKDPMIVRSIDMLFIDGPPGGGNREATLPYFLPAMAVDGMIVADDLRRIADRAVWSMWLKYLAQCERNYEARILATDRGLGVIQLQDPTNENGGKDGED